ncbi:glycosyltransferase family 61 protein [Agromyces sp. Marseille-Q5079]|uniref:glycosyltransferase family 61 protein n=1 Tax=Agromyces sp. Marseille-Q5079 TaxID=3439059 RepID=UPI003D9C93EC
MRDRFTRTKRSYDYRLPPARQFGERPLDFSGQLAPRVPELGVHTIRNATVVGPGWVLDRDRSVVPSISWHGVAEKGPDRIRETHELGGTAITLGTTWGNHYGHMVPDGLSRLGLIPDRFLRRADRILVPHTREAPQARLLLHRMGIDTRVVEMEWSHAYKVDRLYAPTFPGLRRQYDAVVPDTLRGAMPEPVETRKLFVTRRGYSRNPSQVAEVESMAAEIGYEIYDPMQSGDQALDFRNAIAVAGVSGSGLTGIGYMRPGARVFEMFSDAHLFAYYASLSAAGDLVYGYAIGQSPDNQKVSGASTADFEVDLAAVAAGLHWAAGR